LRKECGGEDRGRKQGREDAIDDLKVNLVMEGRNGGSDSSAGEGTRLFQPIFQAKPLQTLETNLSDFDY